MITGIPIHRWAWVLALCAFARSSIHPSARDYDSNDYYALHVRPFSSPEDVALHLGLTYEGPFDPAGDNHHIFSAPKHSNDVVTDAIQDLELRRRKRDPTALETHILDDILFQQKQVLKQRLAKRSVPSPFPIIGDSRERRKSKDFDYAGVLGIKDPIFHEQWHLHNPKDAGYDLNVTGVWTQGITGINSTVCIIDDGLDFRSKDLADNYFPLGSYDFNDRGPDPLPRLSDDRHGTRCAGEVAAGRNDACGVGVAYDAKVAAVRILSKPITDVDEAESVVYGLEHNDIYSCSWGPPDDGKTMDGPSILIRRALVKAVQQGRKGKGTIYVFAAGNGAAHDDNCNFDGYTNSIYSITVGAIDKKNQHPYYSEQCSAQLVVTYSSGGDDAIHTTDVGENECTGAHGGTSAAGPLAAGVFALVLQARPEITWRDAQWLTVLTAVPFYDGSDPSEWQKTPLGLRYHHQYGYGKLDAYSIVEMAKTWRLVNKQAWLVSPWIPVYKFIPEGNDGVESIYTITSGMLKEANLKQVEHVTVTMTVEHDRRGDISVELHSPDNIISYLSTDRERDDAMVGYTDWTFMSVVHWGEQGRGDWKLIVRDTHPNQFNGTFDNWRLKLWGESIDSGAQPLRPFPEIVDDVSPRQEDIPPIPSPKPDPTTATTSSSTSTSTAVPGHDQDEAHNGFLPNPFPKFNISAGAKVWVYGALGLIVLFVCGLAGYFLMYRRRRRLRTASHGDYEFAILPDPADMDSDDEADMADGIGHQASGAGRTRATAGTNGRMRSPVRTAGELYDAFGKLSDDSDDDEIDHPATRPIKNAQTLPSLGARNLQPPHVSAVTGSFSTASQSSSDNSHHKYNDDSADVDADSSDDGPTINESGVLLSPPSHNSS